MRQMSWIGVRRGGRVLRACVYSLGMIIGPTLSAAWCSASYSMPVTEESQSKHTYESMCYTCLRPKLRSSKTYIFIPPPLPISSSSLTPFPPSLSPSHPQSTSPTQTPTPPPSRPPSPAQTADSDGCAPPARSCRSRPASARSTS